MGAKKNICLALALLLLFCASGCGAGDGPDTPGDVTPAEPAPSGPEKPVPEAPEGGGSEEPPPEPEPEKSGDERIAEKLASMTLREKVGQLFIVRPNAIYAAASGAEAGDVPVTELTEEMAQALKLYPVGGFAMFWQNITGPEQITAFIADLQAASGLPLFIAADEEGGQIARLANTPAFDLPKFESPAAVGASGDTEKAYAMGRTIGEYMRGYGFNMDFAPVADVNTNPDNPVIGDRAFSDLPIAAAEMAEAMAEGLRGEGVIPVFKHFPGHGDTGEDSHTGMAVSAKSREAMEACEFIPFLRARDDECVMVGHITAPGLSDDGLPASLSRQIVTGILRRELDFQGLIITDALEMGAVSGTYGGGEAALAAFLAGCDILLMPEDLPAAFEALLSAAESGEISPERLDESVARILAFKEAYLNWPEPES